MGLGTHPSKGLKNGVVVDIESTVAAIQEATNKAEFSRYNTHKTHTHIPQESRVKSEGASDIERDG